MRLHYVDYGGHGEPLVALHGFVQNARAFDAIAPLLVPHVRLLALDVRGRGDSDWGPPDGYRWNFYLRDLRGFFDALGLARLGLIGTSMGGTIALLYAMAHPAEVTRLVLNDIVLNTNYPGVVRTARRIGRAPAEFAGFAQAVDWFLEERDGLDRLGERSRLAWVSHFLARGRRGGLRFNCDPVIIRRAGLIPPQLGSGVRWCEQQAVWEQMKRLTMPVLILRGEKSDVVLPENAQRMVDALPAARWIEVPGAGHTPTLYEAEAQAALREFFGVPRRRAAQGRLNDGSVVELKAGGKKHQNRI
jgi:pimeloyl-ACP methyl ester carboxylesterase